MPDEKPLDKKAHESPAAKRFVDRGFMTPTDPLGKILDLADDAIISVDHEERILLFNQSAGRMFGYTREELVGQSLDILLPSRPVALHRRHMENAATFAESQREERIKIRGRRKDRTEFAAEASISTVGVNGGSMFTVILRDVTQRLAADERVQQSLREQGALLREIHHRVKNNLQVVSSLLGLQSRAADDEHVRKMLKDSQDRIHSMALLHEVLYQSNTFSRVNLPDYIWQIASHLFSSFGIGQDRIRLLTKLEAIDLSLDAAVPCGLIINELISNALKYAFPDGRKGEVRIELLARPGNMARLVVADNGIGLHHIDWATARSLGMRLVRTLADQIGAEVEVNSSAGTEIQLTFPAAA
ncbi:MAG TPA: histidine kinase dimerization/phosphoacceptor domain -containing protein [Bryobacteraceae bacterium]